MSLFWLPDKNFLPASIDPIRWRDAQFYTIPVLSADAIPSPRMRAVLRRLFDKLKGKAPGVRHADGTWSLLFDWRRRRFSRLEMLDWRKWQPRPNLGMALGECGFLDGDILHPALIHLSPMVYELALTILGPAPIRIGRAPKFGLLYRLEAPFRRQAVKFHLSENPDAAALVEFLAEGQQAVVAGTHPDTRQPYVWDQDPTRIGLADLPLVSQADVALFMQRLCALLEHEGCVVGGSETRTLGAAEPPDQAALKAPNPHVLMEIAEHLPNTEELYPSRHDAITMGYRFKAAAQGFDQEGLFAWCRWLEEYDGPCGTGAVDFNADFEAASDEWRRMVPPYRTGGYPTLRKMAIAAGWTGGLPYAGPVAEPPTLEIAEARRLNAELGGLAFAAVEAWRRATAEDEKVDCPASDLFALPPQLAIGCDVGLGKTEQTIRTIVDRMRADPDFTAAILVPLHLLGDDIAQRINALAGEPIAATWRGRDRPDPKDPAHRMCRRHEEAEEISQAGGDWGRLCGNEKRGWCPHHPDNPDRTIPPCAYVSQRRTQARLWIAATQLLTHAVPAIMRREGRHAFDLVVIDEAPVTGVFLRGFDNPYTLTLDELTGLEAAQRPEHADDLELPGLFKTLRALQTVLTQTPDGYLSKDTMAALRQARTIDFDHARRLAYRLKVDIDSLIRPDMTRNQVKEVAAIGRRNVLLFKIARLLALLSQRETHPLGAVETIERKPVRHLQLGIDVSGLRMRWRADIDAGWLKCPILVLDATLQAEIVRELLPRLDVLGHARARIQHCAIVQMIDAEWTMQSLKADTKDARANRALVVWLLAALAARTKGRSPGEHDVLGIVPLDVRRQLEEWDLATKRPVPDGARQVPPRVALLHYGSERGIDAYRNVTAGLLAGRLQISTHEAELMAAVWFNREVAKLERNERYPQRGVSLLAKPPERLARLPAELRPIGRPAHTLEDRELVVPQSYHPDPFVECIRRTVTEDALDQALGRYRAVNRTADNPALVMVLTNVPMNVEVDYVIRRNELDGVADTLAVMASRALAVIPAHRGALAALMPDLFPKGARAVRHAMESDPELRDAFVTMNAYRALMLPDVTVYLAGQIEGTTRHGRDRALAVAIHPNKNDDELLAACDVIAQAAGFKEYELLEFRPPAGHPQFKQWLRDQELCFKSMMFNIARGHTRLLYGEIVTDPAEAVDLLLDKIEDSPKPWRR